MINGRVVHNAAQAHRTATELRYIHERELSLATRKAIRDAVNDKLPQLVRVSAVAHLPSGYGAPVLAPSLRVKTRTVLSTSRGSSIEITIWGQGVKEHRDVLALNRGRLRHPVFGRKPWVTQRVQPGFVDRAVTALGPTLARDIDVALSKIAARFNVGG